MSFLVDWRYNPFTEQQSTSVISEARTIALIPELQIYGFYLTESPNEDSGISIHSNDTDEIMYTETSFSTAPDAFEFRVDWGGRSTESALVECSYANNGSSVIVSYRGKGSSAHSQNIQNSIDHYLNASNLLDVVHGAAIFENPKIFTSSGSYSVPEFVTRIKYLLIGGGGGGAGASANNLSAPGTCFGTAGGNTLIKRSLITLAQADGGSGGGDQTAQDVIFPLQGVIGSDRKGRGKTGVEGITESGGAGGYLFLQDYGAGGAGGDINGDGGDSNPASGAGGGAGNIIEGILSVTPLESLTITVGAAGIGGTADPGAGASYQNGTNGKTGLAIIIPNPRVS